MRNRDTRFKKGLKKLALASGAVFMAASLAGAQPYITTELNGSRLTFDQPPVMEEGRVLVPLRGIFESLGATVVYNPATKNIKATGNDNTVELTLGQRQAFINGQQVYLDVPADTISGRTMVPLRFVSEAMGADVRWQSSTKTVAITTDTSVSYDNDRDEQPVADRPEINQLIHSARGTLNTGDVLTVTMTGDAGAQASFSILGAINNVQMNEVSPGRYEGSLRVTHGMDVNNGTLVGYLKKNNMETVREAGRDVTIATTTNYNPNQQTTSLSPSPGTVISQQRPTVRVVFPEDVRPGTATITLNGQNYTPNVAYDGQTLTLTPSFNLNQGTHTVMAQALTQDGRVMQEQWNFTVSQTANVNNPSISVSNLRDGSTVPAVFNVIGQTTPYAKVRINATSSRSLIPGIIGIQGREFTTSTVADGQGRFNVQLDTSNLANDAQIDLEVSALESDGTVSDTVDLNLRRQ